MPRTKTPNPPVNPQPASEPALVNGLADEVLTLAEAAVYLKLSEDDVLRLVDEQGLPARRLANQWRFLKAAIRQWLSVPQPTSNKEAWLALAGIWQDDPQVEEELEEIYRQRGRPMNEGLLALAGSCKDDPDLERIVEEAYRARGRPITEDGSYRNFEPR